jgi:flagella basal body P-ring formation protein FlgA
MKTSAIFVLLMATAPVTALGLQSADEVADAIRDSVASCHPNTDRERYEVIPLHSLEHLELAAGDRAIELLPPSRPCGVGRQTYHLRVRRDERVVLVPVGVEVKRFVKGYGAGRVLGRGAEVRPADLELAWFDVTYKRADPLGDLSLLEGHVTRTRVGSGSMLTADLLVTKPVVTSGSPVTVRYAGAGFHILVDGVAREDGVEGDRIRVKNLASGRILRAVVVAPGVVEL